MMNRDKQFPITSRFKMLKSLILCKTEGTSLAVWSERFQDLLRVCTVQDIRIDEDEGDVVVILNEPEVGSHRRDSVTLFLNEIEQISIINDVLSPKNR
jgi:hypothetical protein